MTVAAASGFLIGRNSDAIFGLQRHVWAISLYTGTTPFDLTPAQALRHPVITKEFVTDVNAAFVADPFLIKDSTGWFMFFEILNERNHQGDIGYATSPDGFNWTYGSIVLDEPFHLSYPHVFRVENEYYMIPESYQAYGIRLYKCVEFPTQWAYVRTLIEGSFVDPTPFQYEGRWWMFAANAQGNDSLYLYWADSLTGIWAAHPQSPVVRGNANFARPGGRVLSYNSRLYRFAQDDEPEYGNQLWGFEITKLTASDYSERLVSEAPILTAGRKEWNRVGMHHLDLHPLPDGTWLAVVDGYKHVRYFKPSFPDPEH